MTVKWNKEVFRDGLMLCGLLLCGMGLLVFSKPVSAAIARALGLCTQVLLPSLFPFLVLSSFMISSGVPEHWSKRLHHTMQKLFGLSGCFGSAILLGAVGGYPVGARTVAMLYRQQLCSRQAAEKALIFCNNAGPAFLIGAIGAGLLNEPRKGLLLYGVHISAALLIGIIGRRIYRLPSQEQLQCISAKSPPVIPAFLQAVTSSFSVFLNVCAFVLLFAVVMCLLEETSVLSVLAGFLPGQAPLWHGLFCGVLELTTGADVIVRAGLPDILLLPCLSFLCGWGGLSVQLQTICILHDEGLPCRRYLAAKGLQGILAATLTIPFCI